MPENAGDNEELRALHRKNKALERSNAGKVLRGFARQLKTRGYVRKSTFFARERGHVIQFLHVHKFSFGPCFRVHACIRVLNDSRSHPVLNGISSDDHAHYRMSIEFQNDEQSLNTCAEEMLSYVTQVVEPWFNQQTYSALLGASSPLYPEEREALKAALSGESNEANIALSRSLLGV